MRNLSNPLRAVLVFYCLAVFSVTSIATPAFNCVYTVSCDSVPFKSLMSSVPLVISTPQEKEYALDLCLDSAKQSPDRCTVDGGKPLMTRLEFNDKCKSLGGKPTLRALNTVQFNGGGCGGFVPPSGMPCPKPTCSVKGAELFCEHAGNLLPEASVCVCNDPIKCCGVEVPSSTCKPKRCCVCRWQDNSPEGVQLPDGTMGPAFEYQCQQWLKEKGTSCDQTAVVPISMEAPRRLSSWANTSCPVSNCDSYEEAYAGHSSCALAESYTEYIHGCVIANPQAQELTFTNFGCETFENPEAARSLLNPAFGELQSNRCLRVTGEQNIAEMRGDSNGNIVIRGTQVTYEMLNGKSCTNFSQCQDQCAFSSRAQGVEVTCKDKSSGQMVKQTCCDGKYLRQLDPAGKCPSKLNGLCSTADAVESIQDDQGLLVNAICCPNYAVDPTGKTQTWMPFLDNICPPPPTTDGSSAPAVGGGTSPTTSVDGGAAATGPAGSDTAFVPAPAAPVQPDVQAPTEVQQAPMQASSDSTAPMPMPSQPSADPYVTYDPPLFTPIEMTPPAPMYEMCTPTAPSGMTMDMSTYTAPMISSPQVMDYGVMYGYPQMSY